MTFVKYLILFSVILKLISAQSTEYKQLKWCIDSEYVGANGAIVSKESCKIRPCIISTVKHGYFQYKKEAFSMANESFSLDFSQILTLYHLKEGKLVTSDKKFDEQFQVVTYKKEKMYLPEINNCTTYFIPLGEGEEFNGYFLDDGTFNFEKGILPREEYVVQFTAKKLNGVWKAGLSVQYAGAGIEPIDAFMDEMFAYVSLVSCFFMILVLVVYIVIKELRTTAGLIQMSYVAVLAVYFLLKAIQDLGSAYKVWDTTGCHVLSPLISVFDFTRLIWLNIMAYDIWWTLRSIFLYSGAYQRVNYTKFKWYCCIGWVPPLVYVSIEVILDELTTYGPKFMNCSADGNPWYTAGVMVPLQILNTIALVLTIYNLRRIHKSLQNLDSAESFRSGPKKNAFLTIKICLVMGTDSLLMETILFLLYGNLPHWFKFTARFYIASVGVILFLIFVLKSDVLLKLFRRFYINNGITRYLEKRVSSKQSSTSTSRCRG